MRTAYLVVAALAGSCRCGPGVTALTPADLHVEPSSLSFPDTYVGQTERLTITVTNRGQQPGDVTWSSVAPFLVSRSELSVGGGESVDVTIEFAPTVPGLVSATIGSGTLEVALQGTGIEVPQCTADVCNEARFDFASRQCRTSPAADETVCLASCVVDGRCRAGTCVGRASDCSDSDACTVDACGNAGCTHTPRTCPAPANPCRVAVCDSVSGCSEEDVLDGTLCGPDTCAANDVRVCIAGACVTRPRPTSGQCQNTWVPIEMPARSGRAVTWDSDRKRVLAFGGSNGTPIYDDTWEFDGALWTQRFPAQSPPPLQGASLAYDSDRHRAVLFGGLLPDAGFSSQTWEFDGQTWLLRSTPVAPVRRYESALVYDAARRRTLLFGGARGNSLGDTWEWDGTRWTERVVPGPRPRSWHAMAFDRHRGKVVLVGGVSATQYLDDLWEWDGAQWSQRTLTTNPGPRALHGLAYDAQRQRVVMLFGASSGSLFERDVWEWDGVDWSERRALAWPSFAPQSPNTVWDDVRSRLTVVSSNSVVSWNGTEWLTFKPSYRWPSVAFDSHRGTLVVFGGQVIGSQLTNETWELNGSKWSLRAPAVSPSPRYGASLSFDADRNRMVLFGGTNKLNPPPGTLGEDFDDTWEWDGTNWQRVVTSTSPDAGFNARLVFVPPLHKSVLIPLTSGARWSFDGANWQLDSTTDQATGRLFFDTAAQRLSSLEPIVDFSVNRRQLEPTGWGTQTFPVPWPRPDVTYFSATYDPSRSLALLHFLDANYRPQTWEFDGVSFTRRFPRATPRNGGLIYDSTRRKVLLYDGTDTWVFLP